MTSIDDRYQEIDAAMADGRPFGDIDPYAGLSESEREELASRLENLTDEWINRAVDPDELDRAVVNDPQLERIKRSVEGESGTWPSMLPRLREREGIGRDELARRLAHHLGATDPEKGRRHYHRLEWGRLPGEGGSETVLEKLSELLDADVDELKDSGNPHPNKRKASQKQRSRTARTFARFVGGDVTPGPASVADDTPQEPDWDETDRPFLGG